MTQSSRDGRPVVVLSLLLGLVIFLGACGSGKSQDKEVIVTVKQEPLGKTEDGRSVALFTLTHKNGTRCRISEYGAIVVSLEVPDRQGHAGNTVLGFDDLAGYLGGHPYFGAIVGRVANRIKKGQFSLEGKDYQLATNNGPNHLHGGDRGFDKRVWSGRSLSVPDGLAVAFSLTSPDGEENYPGKVELTATYTLARDGSLRIDYRATSDRATPFNPTHHSYFNLAGPGSGTIRDHQLKLMATKYTPTDATLVPTGEIAPVTGTPFDFTTATAMGARLDTVEGGYDLNYVLHEQRKGDLTLAAEVYEPTTGRVMEILTTKPGIQFYTGNFLDGIKGAEGKVFAKHGGFCLEPQHFPDSVNQPSFPDTILRPGEEYAHTTVFRFGTR